MTVIGIIGYTSLKYPYTINICSKVLYLFVHILFMCTCNTLEFSWYFSGDYYI